MIDFHCNICNQKISVSNQHLRKAVRCFKCGNVLQAIPEVQVESSADDESRALHPADQDQKPTPTSEPSESLPSKEETPRAPRTSRSLNAIFIAALALTFSFASYMAVKQFRPTKTDQKASPQIVKPSPLAGPTTKPTAVGLVDPNKPSPELARPQIDESLEPIPPKPITPSPIDPAPPAPPKPVTPPPIAKVEPTA